MSFSSRQRHYHQPRNYRQNVYWRHFFVLRWQRQRNSSAIRFFAVTMSTVSFLSLSAICKLLHRITHRYLTPQRLPNDDAFDWQHRYDSLASLCLTRGRICPRYTVEQYSNYRVALGSAHGTTEFNFFDFSASIYCFSSLTLCSGSPYYPFVSFSQFMRVLFVIDDDLLLWE